MFEAAELGRKIGKKEYKKLLPDLRAQLLQAQFALSKTNVPVIIIVSGIDGAGRGDVVNALNEWLDTRGVETYSIESLTDEERERPYYWRFWRRLPARGRIGIFFGGWYIDPILQGAHNAVDTKQLDDVLIQIRRFETMLVEDGALILKFWLHLSKEEQIQRLQSLEKDPNSRRIVSEQDWQHAKLYDQFIKAAELTIRQTDSGTAPWLLVEASNWCYRDLAVARTVLEGLLKKIDHQSIQTSRKSANSSMTSPTPIEAATITPTERITSSRSLITQPMANRTVLDMLDLTQRLRGKSYRKNLEAFQGKLQRLTWAANQKKRSTVIVFEGWDAAGKGGAIRRMTQAMDARLYKVISTTAPSDEERAHHYLWRFWRHIPRSGVVTIYDRSWYGRVLVERIENFAREDEWMRAYAEINNFEEQLTKYGNTIIKFWIHISPEEQLKRFKEREQIAYKQHKITDEDWRNREKWPLYTVAVNDMVARTSTDLAPWTLVAGNDKRFARLEVLKTVCDRLESALEFGNMG